MSTSLVRSGATQTSKAGIWSLLSSGNRNNAALFPFLPRPIKWIFLLLVLLNFRAFPLVWHLRVYRTIIAVRLRGLFKWSDHFKRRRFLDTVSPIGVNPFELVTSYKTRVGLSDCDYNGHLSNSAYAKNLDYARMKAAVICFPTFLEAKGWLGLGGATFHYVKEIPLFTEYEVRVSIGGWGEKWMYLVVQFVTYPKGKKTVSAGKPQHPDTLPASAVAPIAIPSPLNTTSLRHLASEEDARADPTSPLSSSTSSLSRSSSDSGRSASSSAATSAAPSASSRDASPSRKSRTEPRVPVDHKLAVPALPEGAILHCLHVSSYCFKHGRITVPPRVALVACGFGDREKGRWERIAEIRNTRRQASPSSPGRENVYATEAEAKTADKGPGYGGLRSILRGGWREYESEGLWDLPEYEEQRRRGVEAYSILKERMDELKG